MKRIELDIVALSHSVTQSHNYAVVLGERRGQRRLPIVIGSFEAQAIAVAMERMVPNRPLTHDLFKNTLDTFDIQLREVVINNLTGKKDTMRYNAVPSVIYTNPEVGCVGETEESAKAKGIACKV
ncbi:MAG TPA: DUF151 domain-containing protein, partial [Saprospiraceae bacterium]|nr:DUF151 domain-containing protein [Saprospiraceae bacterium]